MTARLDGQPPKPRQEPLKRPDCPWACVTWRDGGMMAEPQFFATREEANAARPTDQPSAVVNITRKPNARNQRVIPVIGEIVHRHARAETPYPDHSISSQNGRGNYNPKQRHAPGLRPLTAPAATRARQQPPPGMVTAPAPQRAIQAAMAGVGTLSARAVLAKVTPRRYYARCVNGHRLAPDNWFHDCRGSVCCLRCYRARRRRERQRRSTRRRATRV